MRTRTILHTGVAALSILGAGSLSTRALPPSFTVTALDTNAVGAGDIFLEVTDPTTNVEPYALILDNAGTAVWSRAASNRLYDFKVLPNGYLHYAEVFHDHAWTEGGDARHELLDPDGNPAETIQAGNGYVADAHDFQMLPNGHVLLLGYYKSQMNLAAIVTGAYPNALVSGAIIQELDAGRQVIWQWRSWDHYTFASYYAPILGQIPGVSNPVVDAFHFNSVVLDTDGHLLISNYTVDVQKISRQTGDVLWRLGGFSNQFSFVNVNPTQALGHFAGHAVTRLANSNILVYCNGDAAGTRSSAVYEYRLDESNKVATLVWSHAPATNVYGSRYGSAQRLANGNTFIGWGGATNAQAPACTEVTPAGQVAFQMQFDAPQAASYRAFRFPWPPTESLQALATDLAVPNHYAFTNSEDTGVAMDVGSVSPGGYSQCTVSREPYAPVAPTFPETAPRLLPVRVKMSTGFGLETLGAVVSFDTEHFGFTDPGRLTIYYRPTSGLGVFVAQPTYYDAGGHQVQAELSLTASAGDLGEVAFGYPDVAPAAYPPILNEVEGDRGAQTQDVVAPLMSTSTAPFQVNQQIPVALSWSPRSFAGWYEMQIATDTGFASPVVTEPYLTAACYVWSNAAPGTTYYYRVKTWNDAGESDWAAGAFQTVAPALQLTAPNGGEIWRRGSDYFIQWSDNVAENVVIDLYQGGVFARTLATNESRGACKWTVAPDLAPATDYTIRVTSQTNGALFDASDLPFAVVDVVPVTVTTVPTGLPVIVDGTNYTSPAVFDWDSGSLHSLEATNPPPAGDGHSRYAFAAWSDAGAQSHSIAVPGSGTTYTATYTLQYLLDTAVAPAGAGTVSNSPAGPWYDTGTVVSLTALTNATWRFNYWQGTDSASSNTAQVTMNAYRLAQANFQPRNFPYLIVTNPGGAAPGQIIGNIGGRTTDGTTLTYVILDATGTNAIFSSTTQTLWRFVTPQGYDAVAVSGSFRLKDETFAVVKTNTTLGYTLDTHDIEVWPNGHTLLFSGYNRTVDMSQYVTNGKPAASVLGNVIQEIDADGRLVFEWHTFDHIDITNTFADMTQSSFDYAHVNNVTIDPIDNNLLASLRTTSEIIKIDRRTGEVLWRLGGKMNQFTYIGEHAENAPYYTVGQHDVHRLANGNLLFFDNGNISGGGTTPSDRTYSRTVEYAIDEVNKVVTLVREFRHTPDISAGCTGSLKKMPNGNTFIDWGCAVPGSGYICTEVSAAGDVVFEMRHRTNAGISQVLLGGGLTKQYWNDPVLIRSSLFSDVTADQTYASATAGVSVTVNSLSGPTGSTLTVQRHLDAVRFPQFAGKEPQVTMEHIVLAGSNITAVGADLSVDLPDTNYVYDAPIVHDPAQVVVYQRPTPGQGLFTALPTTWNAGAQKLEVTVTQLGEFVFAYADMDETPYAPQVVSPTEGSTAIQGRPLTLQWKPQGLVGSFDVQVALDAGFASPVADTNGLGSNTYVLPSPAANTQYYWRVRTVNQGGTSDWVSASFLTAPAVLQLTYPAGGEAWYRFQTVTILWTDNIPENVALDLYKGGVSNRTFSASTPSVGSFSWQVGQFSAIPYGTDYTIKVRSTTDPSLYDFSEMFTLVTNLTKTMIVTAPTGLTVAVDGTNGTSPAVFLWVPQTPHSIAAPSPQLAGDGHSRTVWSSWSDAGAQSHTITVPFAASTNAIVTNTANFSTEYLLDVAATPAVGGSVTNDPVGPWYAAGQTVTVFAVTNYGYQLASWSGVDSSAGSVAQVGMTDYRAVQAVYELIDPRLMDGIFVTTNPVPLGVAFAFAAPGGTQATVWSATNLVPADWLPLTMVPVISNSATFTDTNAPALPQRFYYITMP